MELEIRNARMSQSVFKSFCTFLARSSLICLKANIRLDDKFKFLKSNDSLEECLVSIETSTPTLNQSWTRNLRDLVTYNSMLKTLVLSGYFDKKKTEINGLAQAFQRNHAIEDITVYSTCFEKTVVSRDETSLDGIFHKMNNLKCLTFTHFENCIKPFKPFDVLGFLHHQSLRNLTEIRVNSPSSAHIYRIDDEFFIFIAQLISDYNHLKILEVSNSTSSEDISTKTSEILTSILSQENCSLVQIRLENMPFSSDSISSFVRCLASENCPSNLVDFDLLGSESCDPSPFIESLKNPFLKRFNVELKFNSLDDTMQILKAWMQPSNFICEISSRLLDVSNVDKDLMQVARQLEVLRESIAVWRNILLAQTLVEGLGQYCHILQVKKNSIWESSIVKMILQYYFQEESIRLYVIRHLQGLSNEPDLSELESKKTAKAKAVCTLC
jgi:hypothetical protein